MQLRGVHAIFIHSYETHGVSDNSAMIVPLDDLLLGNGSVRPLIAKDFRASGERKFPFPLAHMREWNMMLMSAKLMSDC